MTLPSLYNLIMGGVASAGLFYLLYIEVYRIRYRPFLLITTVGLLMFSLGSPLTILVAPRWIHFVHGTASLLVFFGLYSPVRNDLRTDEWIDLLWRNPRQMRRQERWMTPLDDRILELFHSSDLVLTPAIIAYNLDYSREEVNRRLGALEDHGFVKKVEHGKYHITDIGKSYLSGHSNSDYAVNNNKKMIDIVVPWRKK